MDVNTPVETIGTQNFVGIMVTVKVEHSLWDNYLKELVLMVV
jgi:hypothetical protein